MPMNTNNVLVWLKEFQYSWLPQNIINNTHLITLITNKLHELEHLLIQNHQGANESENQCIKSSDIEQRPLTTQPDISNQKDDENKKREVSYRPIIHLKRISLDEAQCYLPTGWKPPKPKRNRKKSKKSLLSNNYSTKKKKKKNTPTNKVLSSSIELEISTISNGVRKSTRSRKSTQLVSSNSLTSIQSTNDNNQKKNKRKLRAIDGEDDDLYTLGNLSQIENSNGNIDCDQISRYIGQHGILSQTRKINETLTTTTTTIHDDNDFKIKLTSRQEKKISNDFKLITTEAIPIDDDIILPTEEQLFPDGIDSESLFTSLDKQFETNSVSNNNSILNYDDCIEDITNDGIDPPPTTSSSNLDHIPLTT